MVNFITFNEIYKYHKGKCVNLLIEPKLSGSVSLTDVSQFPEFEMPSFIHRFLEANKFDQRCIDCASGCINDAIKRDKVSLGVQKVVYYDANEFEVNLIYFSEEYYGEWVQLLADKIRSADCQCIVR